VIGPQDLEHGTWVVVLRADEIPHVVMLQEGVCYSLEHNGNRRYPARKLWRLVEGKRIPSLFCELGSWARGPVEQAYAPHAEISGEGDCFLPVRDYCAAWLPECGHCRFPYELVPLLASAAKLRRAGTRFLQEERTSPEVTLPTYSREEIRQRIASVRATHRQSGPKDRPE
jgi:hypothetical protein